MHSIWWHEIYTHITSVNRNLTNYGTILMFYGCIWLGTQYHCTFYHSDNRSKIPNLLSNSCHFLFFSEKGLPLSTYHFLFFSERGCHLPFSFLLKKGLPLVTFFSSQKGVATYHFLSFWVQGLPPTAFFSSPKGVATYHFLLFFIFFSSPKKLCSHCKITALRRSGQS